MTVPTPCGLQDVAVELGVSSVNLSLSDPAVRTLAGIPSGAIGLKDCEGKSAAMHPNIGGDQGASGGTHSFTLTVTENGGAAPYTYNWLLNPGGPTAGGNAYFSSGQAAKTAIATVINSVNFTTYYVQCACQVTDHLGRVATSNAVNLGVSVP